MLQKYRFLSQHHSKECGTAEAECICQKGLITCHSAAEIKAIQGKQWEMKE